jgi:peptide/nickel transport system substrate-binding protein
MRNPEEREAAYRRLGKSRLSRRSFLELAGVSGLTVTAADLVLSRPAQASPKRGGKLTICLSKGSTTDSLDPATYLDYYMATVGWGSLGNGLTQVDAQGSVQPDLAESFEPFNGAKAWAFKLRKGLSFHNGKTVSSSDVVASIRHHMGPTSKSAVKSTIADFQDIRADGGNIIFTLSQGNADFPYVLSDYHLPIMPSKNNGSVDWESGNRTGPYMLHKFQPGVATSMKRNPNYHRKAWFDEVEILSVVDPVARTSALLSGEVDYIDSCDPKTLHFLKENATVEVDEVAGQAHNVFAMNVTVPPFDNCDVRSALKYGIDREDILRKVFDGLGVVGNDNPVAPGMKFAVDPQPRHTYDPDMAKRLIQKAGVGRLQVSLSAADAAFNGAVDAAVLFQSSALQAGIDIQVVREPNDGYWNEVWMKKPFVASQWYGRPTVGWLFDLAYASGSKWNETGWKNARFNSLLARARSEPDEAKRAQMYAECQQLVHGDGGLINFMFIKYVSAHRKSVAHGELLSNWDIDGLRIAERWWRV